MTASGVSRSLQETLDVVDGRVPGEPLTTSEVSSKLDVSRRSTYERLLRLVDENVLETKKVGARGRIWWRPGEAAPSSQRIDSTPDEPPIDRSLAASVSEETAGTRAEGIDSVRLSDVFENVDVGLFVLDASEKVVWANSTVQRYFGIDDEQVLGRDNRELLRECLAPAVEDSETFTERVLRTCGETTGSEQFECHVTASENRSERLLEHRSKLIESGDYAGGRLELYDERPRRDRPEHVDHEQHEQYERILETIGDGVYAVDEEATFIMVNDAFCELTGYDREELIGEHATKVHAPEITPIAETLSREIAADDDDVASLELDIHTKSGDRFPCESRFGPFPLESDQVGRCGVVRDISERRAYETELEQRVRQQEVVTRLGERALKDRDVDGLMQEATELVSQTLDNDVANILATAINRHDDEQVLVKQRKQLAALTNLHEAVRVISDAIIDQSTREEIESVVCEHLAASNSYEFAWIGDVDHRTQTVTLRAEAGVENYLDDTTISVDPNDEHSEGPTGRAFRTGEIQICQDIQNDPRYEPWRDHASEYGYQSSAAVPIVHDGTTYGVLNVYSARPNGVRDRERTVITQLGEVVGHAIAAVERKRALMSDTVVELGFHIADVFGVLDIDPVEGKLTLDETVPVNDGEFLLYGTVAQECEEALVALIEQIPHWKSVTIHERSVNEMTTYEARLSDPPVLSMVAAAGGTLVEAGIEDGVYHMTVQLSPGSNVRKVINTVKETYPEAEMVTRQQTTRDTGLSHSNIVDINESLTDRQHSVVRAAYHAGFFEWPRNVSGEEVAESLDISAPTFHQHLRKAEENILDAVVPTLV